jgi:hypothetical protein
VTYSRYTICINLSAALVTALYGPRYSPNDRFDIITGTVPESAGMKYITYAIVYTDNTCGNWKIVQTGNCTSALAEWSVKGFVEELRHEFGKLAGMADCHDLRSVC